MTLTTILTGTIEYEDQKGLKVPQLTRDAVSTAMHSYDSKCQVTFNRVTAVSCNPGTHFPQENSPICVDDEILERRNPSNIVVEYILVDFNTTTRDILLMPFTPSAVCAHREAGLRPAPWAPCPLRLGRRPTGALRGEEYEVQAFLAISSLQVALYGPRNLTRSSSCAGAPPTGSVCALPVAISSPRLLRTGWGWFPDVTSPKYEPALVLSLHPAHTFVKVSFETILKLSNLNMTAVPCKDLD